MYVDKDWITSVRDRLPEDGEATLIVAGSDGARYLILSRNHIDNYLKQLRQRAKRFRVTVLAVSGLALIFFLVFLFSVLRMTQDIALRDNKIGALSEPLQNVTSGLPTFAENLPALHNQSLEERIHGLKQLIILQDESFRLYVESTRQILRLDTDRLTDALEETGINREDVSKVLPVLAIGGVAAPKTNVDLLGYYLDDSLLDLLDGRIELEEFIKTVPIINPLRNSKLTSRFGIRRHPISRLREAHLGVDFVSYTDTGILAAGNGIISFAGKMNTYGNAVIIDHGNEMQSLYAHLSVINVNVGDMVDQGQQIGVMGTTGNSTAPHLHYEVSYKNVRIDPLRIIGMNKDVRE